MADIFNQFLNGMVGEAEAGMPKVEAEPCPFAEADGCCRSCGVVPVHDEGDLCDECAMDAADFLRDAKEGR